MRDPHYQKILDALGRELDPNLFEECVADLLRNDFPTLAPVPGGNDAGMDGAIADFKDIAFPLVTTTGKDLLRNLRKNLLAYKRAHGPRKAVFATSRPISGHLRRRLEQQAEKLGFVLVQVFGRMALAQRLYRHSGWCRSLLGLSGDPPALSIIPASSRPIINTKVVGRKNDLRWLRTTRGDRVVVGQPGIGKSFVLARYARSGDALFVVDEDAGKIANAVRELCPQVIIVDDAHARMPVLGSLKHLRTSLGAEYEIVATCWPGARDEVCQELGVGRRSVREMQLMTRDQVVRAVNGAGITGPNVLIREIVNQAQGRVGLAVSLAHACLLDGATTLVTGEALRVSLVDALARLVGSEARQVLASFAMGGERGMTLEAVAGFLNMNKATLHSYLTGLAQGGVVEEIAKDGLPPAYAVSPAALQHGLVREVFFASPRLPLEPLREQADAPSAASVLIGARLRGARSATSEYLRSLFPSRTAATGSNDTSTDRHWIEAAKLYAQLGRDEAEWVLERYPSVLLEAPELLLDQAPEPAISRLLTLAVGDKRPLNATPHHPLRVLGDWVEDHPGSVEASIHRRRAILDSVGAWLGAGGDVSLGVQALCIAFNPQVHRDEADPGSGNKLTYSMGSISPSEIAQVAELWPRFGQLFGDRSPLEWHHLLNLLRRWAHPQVFTRHPAEYQRACRRVAGRMLEDFVRLAQGRPIVLLELGEISRTCGVQTNANVDPEIVTLFRRDLPEAEGEQLRELAITWTQREPSLLAESLASLHREAEASGMRQYRLALACHELARNARATLPFARAFLHRELPDALLAPLLNKAAQEQEPGWAAVVDGMMADKRTRSLAVGLALVSQAPDDIFEKALEHEVELTSCLSTHFSSIPEPRMSRLLQHPARSVAGAAALQEWRADPHGVVRNRLVDGWRSAVLRIDADSHDWLLVEIFRAHADITVRWVLERIRLDETGWMDRHSLMRQAISLLTPRQRMLAVRVVARGGACRRDVMACLVGGDPAIFGRLLRSQAPRDLKLAPLKHGGENPFVPAQLVALAVEAGHSPSAVANAVYGHSYTIHGKASAYWKLWSDSFGGLEANPDPRVKEVAMIGRKHAILCRKDALRREHSEAVYGR